MKTFKGNETKQNLNENKSKKTTRTTYHINSYNHDIRYEQKKKGKKKTKKQRL